MNVKTIKLLNLWKYTNRKTDFKETFIELSKIVQCFGIFVHLDFAICTDTDIKERWLNRDASISKRTLRKIQDETINWFQTPMELVCLSFLASWEVVYLKII